MTEKKQSRYIRIQQQLKDLLSRNEDLISRMATINALLYHKMDDFFWVGFYLLQNDRLLIGPYQGPLACLELSKNKGVCWHVINTGKSIVVPDVHKFTCHIACDPRSKSEIVIPVWDKRNTMIGVMDIDSNHINNFDNIDAEQLEIIVAMLF